MKPQTVIGAIIASVLALAVFFSPVQADLSISGDFEIDTVYTTTSCGDTDTTAYDLGGRIKVAPTARTEAGNLYIEGLTQILTKTDGSPGIDDVWGKIGTSTFDIQIGRFEGYSLFDKSNDMLVADAGGPGEYGANYARGRMGTPGQVALHVLPSDAFALELGLVYGNDTADLEINSTDGADAPDAVSVNVTGIRPVILVKFGPAEFSAGADMLTMTRQDDGEGEISKMGYGARGKAAFGIVTLGINYASGTVSTTQYDTNTAVLDTVEQADVTTTSMAGYCDLAFGKGTLTLAGIMTTQETDGSDYSQEHNQYFISYAHPLPIDGATIKFAVSQASASDDTPDTEDGDALAFKMRLNYNF